MTAELHIDLSETILVNDVTTRALFYRHSREVVLDSVDGRDILTVRGVRYSIKCWTLQSYGVVVQLGPEVR